MGLSAQLIAVGKFRRELVPHLCYDAKFYDRVPEGATIVENVCQIHSTSGSHALARCLGIDAWAFGTHELSGAGADLAGLRALLDPIDFDTFIAFRDAGFTFYFLPNA